MQTRNLVRNELYLGRTSEGGRMYAELELRYARNGNKPEGVPELGISFAYFAKGQRTMTSGGQCGDDCGTFTPDNKLARAVLFLWHGYHLNAMQPGCEHQRAAGWTKYDDHPSEACPVCGYKYGTAWLVAPLPADVEALAAHIIEHGTLPA